MSADFILGPQVPIGTSYFDTTQVSRGKFHGRNFPAIPPTGAAIDPYIMTHYYDLGLGMRIAYERTKDPEFITLFEKVEDSWWQMPWINSGRTRLWLEGNVSPDPRHAGLRGLMLRALDRPEMWDWIDSYERFHLNHWLLARVTDPQLFYGVRPGAFTLQAAALLAKVLPDSFPRQDGTIETNGAGLRAQYLKDAEKIAVEYYGRLQQSDGSWRWDDWDYVDSDGGTLKGIMQPFMVGVLLDALKDVHRVSTNEPVRTNIQNQITKACRHLYSGGPYMSQLVPSLGVRRRGMAYFIHGGTTVNPTKYAKGDLLDTWDTTDPGDVQNMRQGISTIVAAYGYAFLITGDPEFKKMGDELWDAAYGPTDGIRNYMAGDAKSYNQNCSFAPNYLALSGGVSIPTPIPVPTPTPTPSPDGFKGTSVVDSEGKKWTLGTNRETLRDGVQMGGGQGSQYKYLTSIVYTLGIDSNWYKWSGTWLFVGAQEPGTTPTPSPTPTPNPTPAPPAVNKVAWPKHEAQQDKILATQWALGFRLKRNLTGEFAEFEKVG